MTRNEQILQWLRDGKTLREIGAAVGLTGERIRQIGQANGVQAQGGRLGRAERLAVLIGLDKRKQFERRVVKARRLVETAKASPRAASELFNVPVSEVTKRERQKKINTRKTRVTLPHIAFAHGETKP